jgi:NTP pyrophosphatase (non-canonical NTP hydrolase)
MEFSDIQKRALMVREQYAVLERTKGVEWTRADVVRGFVGDVGDLVKLTMAEDGIRTIADSKSKLAHELADCLWSVVVIAEKYGVDLEESFIQTMDELEKRIQTDVEK